LLVRAQASGIFRTAKLLGATVPPSFLAGADEVVE
jgi:hypothetical protein